MATRVAGVRRSRPPTRVRPRPAGPLTGPIRRSLSVKLAAGYLVVSLVVIATAGFVASEDETDALSESAFTLLETEADRKEAVIRLWVDDQLASVMSLLASDELHGAVLTLADDGASATERSAARILLEDRFSQGLSINQNLAELAVLGDPGGEVLVSTDARTEGNFRTRDRYFIEGQEEVSVVGVYERADTLEPAMTVAVPAVDDAGDTVAVIAAHLSLEVLQEAISARSRLGHTGETYIVDRLNNFASSARFGALQLPRGAHSEGIDAAVQGREGGRGTYENYVGSTVLGVYRWLDDLDLALVAEIGRSEATAPARALARRILLIGALAAGFLAVAVALVARRATRPIVALEKAATRVANDQLDVELPVTTLDEIGSLAASFNTMTTRLRESRTEIDTRIAELAAAHAAIALAELHHRTILETALDAVITIDEHGRVTGWNNQAEQIFGWTAEQMFDDSSSDKLIVRCLQSLQVEGTRRWLTEGRDRWARRLETVVARRDGSEFPVDMAVTSVLIGGSPVLCAFVRDITARKETERQLAHQALHDALTNLPNRTLLVERIEHAIVRARRDPRVHFAVLFCDLDRFKVINDSLGHAVGDELLMVVSHRLSEHLRGVDTVARLGGDEFGILMETVPGTDAQLAAAQRIVEELSRPLTVGGRTVHITASVGMVGSSARRYGEPNEMLRDADIAMYRAKAAGGNRVVEFATSMHATAVALEQLEHDIRNAIERDEFCLHYQPVFTIDSMTVAGYEALVRWEHPERGLLCPAAFVAYAEDSGLITAIGSRLLEQACRRLEELLAHPRDGCPAVISVNLSRRQLDDPAIVDQLARLVAIHRIPPGALRLEITETAVMRDVHAGTGILRQLADLGVALHIDDFGTGYSSLSALHELPVTTLKVDRSFIHDVDIDGTSAATVRTVITLARTLGLDVIAEGVETPSQLSFLKELGCDYAQGYLLAHPMPAWQAFDIDAAV